MNIRLLAIILLSSTYYSESFNLPTLIAVSDYLKEHQDSLEWKTKEDGFVRTQLPTRCLKPDTTVSQFNQTMGGFNALRLNFWFPFFNATLRAAQDLNTPHNHRADFASYIVHGGYHHELFKETDSCDVSNVHKKKCVNRQTLAVNSQGTVCLKSLRVDKIKKGDSVYYPTSTIHQLKESKSQSLSLNVVGKPVLNRINTYSLYTSFKQEDIFEEDIMLNPEQNRIVSQTALRLFLRAQQDMVRQNGKSIVYGQKHFNRKMR